MSFRVRPRMAPRSRRGAHEARRATGEAMDADGERGVFYGSLYASVTMGTP